MEASGAQASAAAALIEAAEALSREGADLASQLGFDDAADGINEDGTKIDVANARDARVRGAHGGGVGGGAQGC